MQEVSLVLTVLGPDQPGVVERLAGWIAAREGNWLESRMCRLGGEFAGILRCRLPADRQPALRDSLRELEAAGFAVEMKPDPGHARGEGRVIALELVGQDRPGIVREISGALARQGINVEELSTGCESAPMSGEPLFRAALQAWLPEGCDLEKLRADLERIAADLQVDVSFDPAPEG